MWTLEITSAQFTRRNWNLRILPHYLLKCVISTLIEDVSINEYEYENDLKPYSYSKSFSQLSMLAMTPSSSL